MVMLPDDENDAPSNSGMDEAELIAILDEEEADAASYFNSELASAQTDAMQRYMGRPYGDEAEGRSQVVSHDIEDTINWLLPDLMRVFLSSDDVITVETENPAEDYSASCAGSYLSHIFLKDNDGDRIIHDFAFDGLLQRLGVIHCTWVDPQPGPPIEIEGVGPEQILKYQQDPEYEILEVEPDEDGRGVMAIKVRRTPKVGRVKIDVVPPEEFAYARRMVSTDGGDYHRRKRQVFLGELKHINPDKYQDLVDGSYDDEGKEMLSDGRREARFQDESGTTDLANNNKVASRRKVWVTEEFLRIDYDGDGIPEMRAIKRVGNVILENIEVERSEFFPWSPVRVAHRMVGRSISDSLLDLQRIRTVLMRRSLDGLSQSLTPRVVVNTRSATTTTIDDLIDNVIGGVIEVQGDVRESIQPFSIPDVTGPALQMLEVTDQRVEQATGVTRHSQGIDPDMLNKTASGIALLQTASSGRVEMIARWLAKGLNPVFQHALRLVCRHQDQPRIIKIKGKPLQMDPRLWSDEMSVSVHVGIGAESRQTKVANLGMIAAKQEAIIQAAGPSNPMVTPAHYRATLARMVETMGFKDPGQFFAEVDQGAAPPPAPQKDPKLVEAETKAQIATQELQQKGQLAQADMQHKQQLAAAEFQHKQQLAEGDRQLEQYKAQAKLQSERELAAMTIQSERELATMRLSEEMTLARERMAQELELARERMQIEVKAKANVNGSGDGGDGGDGGGGSYRPGGRLDA